jgi:hypothetical protein
MIDQLNKRVEQIPILREHATQLLSLAKVIVSSRNGAYESNDFLGAMADVFMHKQMDHLKSICILVDAEQNPDALIIARSSFENMALLLWSAHGPPRENRPRRWFLYEIKESYCKMMKGEYDDLGLDPKKFETAIHQDIQKYADILLTKAAKKNLHQGKALSIDPDPFVIRRLPPMKNIFDELKKEGKIDQKAYPLYQILSQWPHGTPQGMGMVFRHDGNFFSHDKATDKYLGGCAIMTGLQSLNITASLFDDHFKLDFQDRLEELRKQYLEL